MAIYDRYGNLAQTYKGILGHDTQALIRREEGRLAQLAGHAIRIADIIGGPDLRGVERYRAELTVVNGLAFVLREAYPNMPPKFTYQEVTPPRDGNSGSTVTKELGSEQQLVFRHVEITLGEEGGPRAVLRSNLHNGTYETAEVGLTQLPNSGHLREFVTVDLDPLQLPPVLAGFPGLPVPAHG